MVVPTRSRPGNAARLARAFRETRADATLVLGCDDDDPCLGEYVSVADEFMTFVRLDFRPRTTMAATLNALAPGLAVEFDAVGFMGDDHLPRTPNWDATVLRVLRQHPGLAYGDDLVHGRALATSIFMSSSVVLTLGYMSPPGIGHLFIDDFWMELGSRAHALTYLPDVVVEHMHPIAGKAERDDGYERVNSPEVWARDEAAYENWKATRAADDVATVRRLLRHG